MRIGSFEFTLRELAGSMGDYGTLIPLAVGYIAVCGLDPAGFLVMMGLANIVTGIVYRLPLPIEPMKVLAVVAITQQWTPSMVYASAFSMGILWLLFGLSGAMKKVAAISPPCVIHGIQAALGVLLAIESYKMLSTWWLLGILSILIVLLFRESRAMPASLVLVGLGVSIMYANGQLSQGATPSLTLPPLTGFRFSEVWDTLVRAGFSQIPLTATNAVIATAALIRQYWPEREVSVRQLSLNHGIMNSIFPFFGGMPLCHGAGGLAGQYYFGARTGGANVIEGVLEISLGIFFARTIAAMFDAFPRAIIGAMMLLVGVELMKFARTVRLGHELIVLIATVVVALVTNMAFGFLAGLVSYHAWCVRRRRSGAE